MRAAGEHRLDVLDELLTAAWHGAWWGGVQRIEKLPTLKDALTKRQRSTARPRTLEEDIRRWELFFRQAGYSKGEAN